MATAFEEGAAMPSWIGLSATGGKGQAERRRSLRTTLHVLVLAALAVGVVGIPSASARNDPFHVYLAPSPFDIDPSACGFPIHADVTVDRVYAKLSTTSDGTVTLHITGTLRYVLTSPTASIGIDASGPADVSIAPDGTTTIVGRGAGLQPFTPDQSAATGLPGLTLFTGLTVLRFDPDGTATLIRQEGIVTDVCPSLA